VKLRPGTETCTSFSDEMGSSYTLPPPVMALLGYANKTILLHLDSYGCETWSLTLKEGQ
jgi:hypothetical protein